MLRRLCLIAVLATGLVLAKDEPFEGKWVLDKGASTATCDLPETMYQKIKKKGDGYQVETAFREPRNGIAPIVLLGIMVTDLKLGPDVTNQVGPYMQQGKTTVNGNQMVTEWTAVVNEQPVTGQWTRTLSDDGKSLTLDIKESTADGKSGSAHLVFKKK